jgi:quinohemoprotein ethanol dehydrogenase
MIASFALVNLLSVPSGISADVPTSPDSRSTDWPFLGGTAQSQQYSSLTQIKPSNLTALGLLRYAELPVKEGLVGNALIRDGVAYESTPRGGAIAVDLASGKVLWNFEPALEYTNNSKLSMWTSHYTRGLGMDAEKVYTADGCFLFAVDRKSGTQRWQHRICDPTHDLGTSSAPRTGAGKVFVGIQNAEHGTGRGYALALDASTGKELWRFYTVPGDPSKPFENPQMEIASKTWNADYWRKTKEGGGSAGVWEGMIYDPLTDLLIFGTGNPAPEDRPWLDSHENLYSDSIIAVHARTGIYAWHYQVFPGDAWGIGDATGHMILADLPLPGGTRHVLMSAVKQLFYVLDAKTGEFISVGKYVPNTNFSSIDPKTGKLTVRDELRVWMHPGSTAVLQPGGSGGHTWILSAYNPQTGLVYIPAFIMPESLGSQRGNPSVNKPQGRLVAWDPVAEKERWHVDQPIIINGGALTTAGNLVFQGTADGKFCAYDAYTGKILWRFETHSIIEAGPSTVTLNGKQLIVVAAGDASANGTVNYFAAASTTPETLMAPSRLLIFGLGGTEKLPPSPLKVLPKPAREKPTAALAAAGETVFRRSQCELCHGSALQVSGQGRIPDLRTITEAQLDAMPVILRQGVLVPLGMPRFPNLSDDDIKSLQAYIENRAWEDYEQQEAHTRAN